MNRRTYYLHYRLIREAITILVMTGTALLASYWIVWGRL